MAGSESMDVLTWWLSSSPFDGMTGAPCGPPQWPEGRGYLETPSRVVGLVDEVRGEWQFLSRFHPKSEQPAPAAPQKRSRMAQ